MSDPPGVGGPPPPTGPDDDPLGPILESFLERYRRGERPPLNEYVGRYPELADEIRELFPAAVEMERAGPHLGAGPWEAHRPSTPEVTAERSRSGAGRPSARLGDYQILRELGSGGMGVVYEAVRESLRSHVALKVMHARFRTDPTYVRRFHIEACSAAQLHHTNIVSVFDYGEHDGVCYYAMQYIAGHGLDLILEDVRRLRGATGGEADPLRARRPVPVPGPTPEGPTEFADPPHRPVTLGYLSGRYARVRLPCTTRGGAAGVDTAPEWSGPGSRSEAGVMGYGEATEQPDAGGRPDDAPARGDPVTEPSSLSGKLEDHFYREVARLAAQAADALAFAHRRGIFHRDVKPSNLLIDAMGNLWVTDFGLAKFQGEEDLSRSHDVVGTLRYMAPERFRGVSDGRCDVYALGATLYEMLTLRPAFPASDQVGLIHRIVHEPPVAPRRIDPRIPRDLETIVLKAMAKDPADRYASADEMADELRRVVDNRPIRSRRSPTYERFWRWCKRNPALATANIAAAVLTNVIAIGGVLGTLTYRQQRDNLSNEQNRTRSSLERAVAAERQARLALGRSLISEGTALQRTGLMGQRYGSLDRLARAAQLLGQDSDGRASLPEVRDRALLAFGLVDFGPGARHHYPDHLGLSVDLAREQVARVDRDGSVVFRSLDGDREVFRLPVTDPVEFRSAVLSFCDDFEHLTVRYRLPNGQRRLRVWDLPTRERLASLTAASDASCELPGGRGLLFSAPEGGIGVWDRGHRRVTRRLSPGLPPRLFKVDPTGRRLAVTDRDDQTPRVIVLDVNTGLVLADWTSHVGPESLAWSADGRLLATGGVAANPRIYVWDVEGRSLVSVLRGHTDAVVNLDFAHAGYLLASASWDGTSRLWDAVSGESLVEAPGLVQRFSPDDRRAWFSYDEERGEIGVSEVAGVSEHLVLHPGLHGNALEGRGDVRLGPVDVSPDGRLLATSDGTSVRLWETGRGREVARLDVGPQPSALFRPDGRGLVTLGELGVSLWPVAADPGAGPDALRVGPPVPLHEAAGTSYSAVWMPDGSTLAVAEATTGRVLFLSTTRPRPTRDRPDALSTEDRGPNLRSVSVTPDGRWLALGGWHTEGILVWDVPARRLDRVLKSQVRARDSCARVAFSVDGRRLFASDFALGYQSWAVGTWEPELQNRVAVERSAVNQFPPVFTPDGRLMARTIAPDQVQLADPGTGRELARLTTVQPITPSPQVFTRDGSKLIATTARNTVLVWDLRRVRGRLAALGVGSDAALGPESGAVADETAADDAGPIPPPPRVRVVAPARGTPGPP